MNTLSLTMRLRLMALTMTVAMLGVAAYAALSYYDASIEQRLSTTRAVVEQSIAIAKKYNDEEKAGKLKPDEARAKAKAEVMAIRYEGTEYVFIVDMHPHMVGHPIKPELDGKDVTANKDPNGKQLFVEFVATVKAKGSGYVDYLWPKVGSDKPVAKRSYVAGFAPWGWVLRSGSEIQRRLVGAESALAAIAEGDLSVAVSPGPDDEIGRLMRSVERTR